jgi:hypothetical protein
MFLCFLLRTGSVPVLGASQAWDEYNRNRKKAQDKRAGSDSFIATGKNRKKEQAELIAKSNA